MNEKKGNLFLRENSIIFFIGSIGYGVVEVAFRGFTHWTMLLTGGICFTILYNVFIRMRGENLWRRCLAGCFIITGIEFAVGCVVNLWLGWNVWDYSQFRFNAWGQVCLLFSVLWFLFCAPVSFLAIQMERYWHSSSVRRRSAERRI